MHADAMRHENKIPRKQQQKLSGIFYAALSSFLLAQLIKFVRQIALRLK